MPSLCLVPGLSGLPGIPCDCGCGCTWTLAWKGSLFLTGAPPCASSHSPAVPSLQQQARIEHRKHLLTTDPSGACRQGSVCSVLPSAPCCIPHCSRLLSAHHALSSELSVSLRGFPGGIWGTPFQSHYVLAPSKPFHIVCPTTAASLGHSTANSCGKLHYLAALGTSARPGRFTHKAHMGLRRCQGNGEASGCLGSVGRLQGKSCALQHLGGRGHPSGLPGQSWLLTP